ncbi:MAG: glycoside hydrolase family 3 N-terminal domain-containing protein [bacterium]
MKIKQTLICAVAALGLMACTGTKSNDPVEQKVEALLSQMTLEEKIGQLNQLNDMGGLTQDIHGQIKSGQVGSFLNCIDPVVINDMQRVAVEESRLGIPLVFARDVIHGYKTIFPIPLGQAASWDLDLIERGARIAAEEATAAGIRWTFSPMIDISRDARWGRMAESFGEDTYLNTVMGVAMIKGYQTDDLSDPTALAACAKHFACYGASEGGKDYNTTWIPEVQLRDVYLPPFQAAADAGCATFMCSFNDINGVPSTGNKHLNIDILREEWGYDGVLVSDWGSADQMIPHGFATDLKDATKKAIDAGMDVDMMSFAYIRHLKELVESGAVKESQIDERVRNILRLKYRLGLFENPYVEIQENPFYTEEALAAARATAAESAVLLKNDGVLPLQNVQSVAVVGPMSDAALDQLGTWSLGADPAHCVTPLAAIKAEYPTLVVNAAKGLEYSRVTDMSGVAAAVAAARKSDVVLFFAGEEAILSGEAKCLAEFSLPGAQREMLQALKATGKPVVTVIMSGRPAPIKEELAMSDALIYSFHAGTMAGAGLADVIFGKVVPSGKLPVTMPMMSGQVPIYYNHKNSGRPAQNIVLIDDIPYGAEQFSIGATSYHLDAGATPLLPFGYGLSYTTFEYSDVTLSTAELTCSNEITATCTITNTGNYDAYEVAQLYVRDLVGELCRPVRELKNFEKVLVKAGESVEVSFTINIDQLKYWHTDLTLRADKGDFQLWIAPNSAAGVPAKFTLK